MTGQAVSVNSRLVDSRARYEVSAAYKCDHCGKLLLVDGFLDQYPGEKLDQVVNTLDGYLENTALLTWLPRSGETREFPDVPDPVASAAAEAHQCFSIGAYRGAISMSRAVIEATAKTLGITDNGIATKIEKMVEQQHLRPGTGAMAHEIRQWGNNMAHGDFAAPISREEAEGVLELMGEVLQEVYQGPARLRRVQQLRQGIPDEG